MKQLAALLRSNRKEAIKVASIVGSVLLLINQYDAIFGESAIRIAPAFLTYCVPFTVFLWGAHKQRGG